MAQTRVKAYLIKELRVITREWHIDVNRGAAIPRKRIKDEFGTSRNRDRFASWMTNIPIIINWKSSRLNDLQFVTVNRFKQKKKGEFSANDLSFSFILLLLQFLSNQTLQNSKMRRG